MASATRLIIFGLLLVSPTLVICGSPGDANNTDPATIEFRECKKAAELPRELMIHCIMDGFNLESLFLEGAADQTPNDTKLLDPVHLCRKKESIIGVIRDTADMVQTFTNKSQLMVPFATGMIVESIAILCENNSQILSAILGEDQVECMERTLKSQKCHSRLGGVDVVDESVICEFPDPRDDRFTKASICQHIFDFLGCAEEMGEMCSEVMKNAVKTLKARWPKETICSKYLP
ncbi:uncharacterized protein LOC124154371 [Ischnura elegans]|uniref:uncharacterized protein LOC124154371 n=1 Tax=Ischnura elegans TaxID=197161 RepID=UPI001ED87B66|nr:uncharacterized protein LOC124154371 [Ischnura elegans]